MANLKNTTINDTGFIKIATGTTEQRPATTAGSIRFNNTTSQIEFANGSSWANTSFTPNEPTLHYYEGRDANLYLGNWNNTTNFTMLDFGQLGCVNAHGFNTGPVNYTLSLSNLPTHTQIRYCVLWHCVDSFDNETNNLYCTNAAGGETEILNFTKVYNTAPAINVLLSGATAVWSGPRTYSYRPWGQGLYNNDGYITIDTGFYNHALTTFSARNYMGIDQGQLDEAAYLTHVQVWIR
jgi:hypothetical protein